MCSTALLLVALTPGCKSPEPMNSPPAAVARFTLRGGDAKAQVAAMMRAAIDMQHNGEPLAEAMGRDLAGYDRSALRPDLYTDPATGMAKGDLVGYSSAVESYEYSKLMMNFLSFESGAGLSLMYGPLLNPTAQTGTAAVALLRDRVQALALASRAGVDSQGPWVIVPAPTNNPLNLLGFPGLWPQFAELASFDSAIEPSGNVQRGCSLEGGYGASAGSKIPVGDYECGYNSLHIARDRAEKALHTEALGLAAWKQALWVINYLQLVHDADGGQWSHVAAADLAQVGKVGNVVQADNDDGKDKGKPGTFLGASDLEGFQALLMTEQIDNKAELLLRRLVSDGSSLVGFASTAAALSYDYQAPLRFIPSKLSVGEQAGQAGADPQPTTYTPAAQESTLASLSSLLGAYGEAFALTDDKNSSVGGSVTVQPVFDGDPFAKDNGMADGESTLHDRSLAVIKLALVNLDRLHFDSGSGSLSDGATISATGAVTRSRRITTTEAARAISALRIAYRALTAQLTLYSDSTPDTLVTSTALDGTSLRGVPGGVALSTRIQQLIKAQADVLSARLLDASGLATNAYDFAASQADTQPTRIESQAAAVVGLLDAYLATGQSTYRDRAIAAYDVLESRFHLTALSTYRTTLGVDDALTWTPERFAAVQSALSRMYVLVASRPGGDSLRAPIESRLSRLNKLILNGWDDENGNGQVDYPGECIKPQAGLSSGLMLAERALTGELGIDQGSLTSDRDRDCVLEIDDAKRAAILGSSITLAPGAASQ
jgi:hypothetical protein